MSYISKIKEKYNIQSQPKSEYITNEDYRNGIERIRNRLCGIYGLHEALEELGQCRNYHLLELWEDPVPGSRVRCYLQKKRHGKVTVATGIVEDSDAMNIYLQGKKGSSGKTSKSVRISRVHLLLVRYTDSQLGLINLQEAINLSDYDSNNKKWYL